MSDPLIDPHEALITLNQIVAARRMIRDLDDRAKRSRRALREAKGAFTDFIDGIEVMPLFDRPGKARPALVIDESEVPNTQASNGSAKPAAPAETEAPVDPSEARFIFFAQRFISEFVTDPGLLVRLGSINVQTIADLRDFLFAHKLLWKGDGAQFIADEITGLETGLAAFEAAECGKPSAAPPSEPPAAGRKKRPKPKASKKRPSKSGGK